MRSVTSMRGRPSSASGIASRPTTRRDSASHTGPDAEQGQRLGHVVALGAHERRAPQHEADGRAGRCPPRRGGARAARRPACTPTSQLSCGGQRLRVDRVEVAAGGQHVGAAAGQRAAGPGGHVAAVEAGQQVVDLVGRSGRSVGHQPRRRPSARCGRSSARPAAATPPTSAAATTSSPAAPASIGVERRAGRCEVEAESRSATVRAQRRHRAVGEAGDGQHEVDQRLALAARRRGCAGRRGSGRPSGRTGSRRRGAITSSKLVVVAARRRGRGRGRWTPRVSTSQMLLAQRRQLGRVERLELGVLVEQLLELGQSRRRCRPGSSAAAGGR